MNSQTSTMSLLNKSQKHPAFTILELLLLVATITILATLVFIAINPGKHFSELRNSERSSDINVMINALSQYALDNGHHFPSGIDTKLRMIGTSTTGCSIACGDHLAMLTEEKNPIWGDLIVNAQALSLDEKAPIQVNDATKILSGSLNPNKVLPGDTQEISLELQDTAGVKNVIADMAGIESITLNLTSGDKFNGTWTGSWLVHDTQERQYIATVSILNNANEITTTTLNWSDPPASSWISPDAFNAPDGQWTNGNQARDNNPITYATNTFGQAGWGQFIYLTLNEAQYINRVRLIADYLDADVINVDIDVMRDGIWIDAFDGGNETDWNAKWAEVAFEGGQVSQARFRYNYRQGGYYYWLYEFQFYQTTPTIVVPEVVTLPATLIQDTYATLHGSITADGGEPCTYVFEYGLDTTYGTTTAIGSDASSGDTIDTFITNLLPNTTYHYRINATNVAGTVYGLDITFHTTMPMLGDLSPGSFTDPDDAWENEINATDLNTATYTRSYHNINATQWSSYIHFTQTPSFSNGVSFFARGLSEVDQVQIEVNIDGAWLTVLNGAFNGSQTVRIDFTQGLVTEARIRFHAATASSGFYYQLNEFSFRKSSEAAENSCIDLSGLVPMYSAGIPEDPQTGSSAKTYYAVKLLSDKRIAVYSCTPELGKSIVVMR